MTLNVIWGRRWLRHEVASTASFPRRAECAKAFSGLVPGIEEKQVNLLVDDIDADGSQTLTVDEIEGYLLAAQTARDPQSTSLGLKPKKPFYTAEGARGL